MSWSHRSSAPQSQGFCCFPKTPAELGCDTCHPPEPKPVSWRDLRLELQRMWREQGTTGSHQSSEVAEPSPGALNQALHLVLEPGFWWSCPRGFPRIVHVAGIPLKYPTESELVPNSIKFPFFQASGPAFGNHWVSCRCREASRAPAVWGNPPSPGCSPGSGSLLPAPTWISRFPRAPKNPETPLGTPISSPEV